MSSRKKAIIVCTWDWYYYSHRRELARMLIEADYEVVVVTKIFNLKDEILADGVRLVELPFSRPSLNPIREYGITRGLRKIYQEEKPDLVYHIAFKPVLYGSLAARKMNIPIQVNAIAGMGQLFLGTTLKIRAIRKLVMCLLRRLFRNGQTRLIVQNQTDFEFLKDRLNLPNERMALIRGVGVDLTQFVPVKRAGRNRVTIAMVSRLIREKGVMELVQASRILKQKKLDFEVQLVGEPDTDSPEQIAEGELKSWESEGLIQWTGFRNDINTIYAEADIACLPSYSEGLPKSLLEATACGLPVVAADNSGCREVVEEGQNGFLVPPKNAQALATALERLIVDPQLRDEFGARSRAKAESEFDIRLIQKQVASFCGLMASGEQETRASMSNGVDQPKSPAD